MQRGRRVGSSSHSAVLNGDGRLGRRTHTLPPPSARPVSFPPWPLALQSVRRMMDIHQPVALLSETTGGDLERSTRYVEYLRPLGLAHEMRGAFTSGGYLWGSMDLIRGSGSPDFEPREANLLRRIAPHLGNGLKMAALRARTP